MKAFPFAVFSAMVLVACSLLALGFAVNFVRMFNL